MQNKLIIIDFGSQYTQLIARKIRELNLYCEIYPFNNLPEIDKSVRGFILSGSTFSISHPKAPKLNFTQIDKNLPILAIGFAAHYVAKEFDTEIINKRKDIASKTKVCVLDKANPIFLNVNSEFEAYNEADDYIENISDNFLIIAKDENENITAFKHKSKEIYGLQFHPEKNETKNGIEILKNFALNICKLSQDWTAKSFVENSIKDLQEQLQNDKVVLGLSGGVDSSVVAALMHKAIGDRLICIFVNNGLLRKNEFETVLDSYKVMGLNIIGVDASKEFLNALAGVKDPEEKRKIIGRLFIEVFDNEAQKLEGVKWLAQGTIYPDVIESLAIDGVGVKIKSHHNVGGLPEKMNLKIVEPLRLLFKDEVRRIGSELKLPLNILNRHPFPGPGLGIRILGDITPGKVEILQNVDAIFIDGLKGWNLYDAVWQAGAMLLPIQSVGVSDNERTYENVVALRAVQSADGMSADWVDLPYKFLAEISTKIINNVKGVNRVVYDISSKPPATIEWE